MLKSGNISKILEEYKNIQIKFLDFLENEENTDENFRNLKSSFFDDTKMLYSQHDLRLFFHFLQNISKNHQRGPNFFTKIETFLQLFESELKRYQTSELFDIFGSNKRILLFLIEKKIMTVDVYFVQQIIKQKYVDKKYPQYFLPEIKPFMNQNWFPKYNPDDKSSQNRWIEELINEIPSNFYELRKKGENDSFLCKLIRDDNVDEFIVYMNKNNISYEAKINPSIYETNSFLLKINIQLSITLIQYSAFFGSIRILTFLRNQKVELTSSLWPFVIHSNNAELICLLEDNHIKPNKSQNVINDNEIVVNNPFNECIKESIKCHHIDIANYLIENYIHDENEYLKYIIINSPSMKYINFSFFPSENIYLYKSIFYNLCCYDYYSIVKILLISTELDIYVFINKEYIQNQFFSITFKIHIRNHIFRHNFYQTVLYSAVEKGNIEIIKLLLTNDKLNINLGYSFTTIQNIFFSIQFIIIYLNEIQI